MMNDEPDRRRLRSGPVPGIAWLTVAVAIGVWLYVFDVKITPSESFLALVGRKAASPAVVGVPTAEELAAVVVPEEGYTVDVTWGDTGVKLVEAGGIDLEKYRDNYSDLQYGELLGYLTSSRDSGIKITRDNAYFWVNTLWALGLTQQSAVLDEGVMGAEYKDELGSFASTGGWTLGKKEAVDLYSSASIVSLTAEQQRMVQEISENVYRPCCGNSTAFPDCNHGMAALGLIELMASQGFGEDEIYQAVLAFNSYWFTQAYTDLAYYFATEEKIDWQEVDPKRVLAADFSSAGGYQAIKQKINNLPGASQSGASCGA